MTTALDIVRVQGTHAKDGRSAQPEYLAAILDADLHRAEAVVAAALLSGVGLADVVCDVIAPALAHVGRMWELDEVSVADEHMATEISTAVVHRLLTPSGTGEGPLAIVTCAPGEMHAIGARAVAALLGHRGWRVVFLGTATPADALEAVVAARAPDLVALSVTMPRHLPEVIGQVRALKRVSADVRVLVGGAAVADAPPFGADHVANDLRAALAWVDAAFQSPTCP